MLAVRPTTSVVRRPPSRSRPRAGRDVVTKIEDRQAADEDDSTPDTSPEERQVSNVSAYHKGEIARLNKAIAEHRAVLAFHGVDDDSDELLAPGTDVGEAFTSPHDLAYDLLEDNFTAEEIGEVLRDRGLAVSGSKSELIERLIAAQNGDDEEDDEEE